MKAIYTNKALNQTYTLAGISGLEQAWKLAELVCGRMNWNIDMFSYDVKIRIEK